YGYFRREYGLARRARTVNGTAYGGMEMETMSLDSLAEAPTAGAALHANMLSLCDDVQTKRKDTLFFLDKAEAGGAAQPRSGPRPDLSQVTARKNLNETAFFFPQLTSDSNGVVKMTFTMPEALTKWRFMGFAHDGSVRSGYLEGHAVTAKDLMVQPNPPRIMREGDTLEFTVKVSNQSDTRQ